MTLASLAYHADTILAGAFVWLAVHWACWLAFGRTPFILISRAALFAESALVVAFEQFMAAAKQWQKSVGPRYAAIRYAEAPLEGRD